MRERTFGDVQRAFTHFYSKKAYAQALEVSQQAVSLFPDDWRVYNWRMCMEARVNDMAGALQTLRDSLDRGLWCDPAVLRNDEDLQALQGLPEYEQLLVRCQQMFAQAQTDIKPELIVLSPQEKSAHPSPLLIALHGNAGNAQRFVDHWRPLTEQGWVVAVPQSSQIIAPGAAIWDDFTKGTQQIQQHYASLTQEYAIDPERIIVAGFSMGGGLVIHLAVSGAIKARGFLGVGPFLPDIDALTPFAQIARDNGVHGYIVLGLQEPPESLERMRKTATFLNSHGIPCEIEEHAELGHAFPADFEQSRQRALAFLMH